MRIHDLLATKQVSVYALAAGIGRSRTRTAAILQQHGASWFNVVKIAGVLGCKPEDIAEQMTLTERPLMEYGRWRE